MRLFWPLVDPYDAWRQGNSFFRSQHKPNFSRQVKIEPGLPGVTGITTFTTNNLGFRGEDIRVRKPAGEFRIILIGGSSIECAVLDDSDSIEAVLQRQLVEMGAARARVYNAGKSGDRSDDHLALVGQRIIHLQPDVVIVLAGFNDLRAAVAGLDYLHLGGRNLNEWALALTRLQVGRALFNGLTNRPFSRQREGVAYTGTPYRDAAAAQAAAMSATSAPKTDVGAFARNLRSIAGSARANGIKVVLMTQQTTWNSDVDPDISGWHWLRNIEGVVYSESAMHTAMAEMNVVVRDFAAEANLPLYDLARDMPKSSAFFYDDVHFNVRGAHEAGVELASLLNKHGWTGRPELSPERTDRTTQN